MDMARSPNRQLLSFTNPAHLRCRYDRKTVKVRLLTKVGDDKGEGNVEGDEVETEVYVFKNPQHLEDLEWDFEEFRSQKMKFWTREDYGFEDAGHFAPQKVDDEDKAAVV